MTSWPPDPFTRADLAELGLTESDLRCGQRAGEIRTVLRGVFVVSTRGDSLELRASALIKAVPPHQVITDRTAAWLHGVDAHTYGEHDDVPRVETCALRGKAPTTIDAADGRTRDLLSADVMTVHGVRVTTPLRTALDLGCCLRRREAFAAMCAMAREHHLTPEELARALPRYRRRRGVVQLRGLVPLVDTRFESQREAWCFLAVADAGLALPEPQVWVEIDGVPTYRLDLAYKRRRVCLEYDGHDAHSSDEQRAYDRARREWLRAHGWTIIIVCEGGFTGEALDQWIGELRAALDPTYSNRRW